MAYERLKKKGIHHVCLRVPDLKKTVDFYLSALDAHVVVEWGTEGKDDHAFILDLGSGDFLEIFESQEHFDLGSWQHVAVWTDDIHASVKRAVEAGGVVESQPKNSDIPTRQGQIVKMGFAFVRAPGNEIIEFIQDRS